MKTSKDRETVPAQPFADWLNQRFADWERQVASRGAGPGISSSERGPLQHLLQEIGWSTGDTGARRLYRFRRCIGESRRGRNMKKGVRGVPVTYSVSVYPRDVVEDALHHAGVLFSEVYPEIAAAEELELEPVKWCPGCQSEVIPIDGVCTWCEWRVGEPTGQVLRGRRLAA